jgi:transcriptional regulator GlxA family with amidase domain
MGISPYQFLLRARVSLAKDMLRLQDGTSRTAIASACGFASLAHMRAALSRADSEDKTSDDDGNPPTPA